jgi:CheY-like chemotaxis protein
VNVTIALDGLELMNLLDELPIPDAIVIDLNMPRKDGKKCLQEIRANNDFVDVPIVILSTSESSRDSEYCLQHGANLYLVKPNSFDAMKLIAQKICNRETYR